MSNVVTVDTLLVTVPDLGRTKLLHLWIPWKVQLFDLLGTCRQHRDGPIRAVNKARENLVWNNVRSSCADGKKSVMAYLEHFECMDVYCWSQNGYLLSQSERRTTPLAICAFDSVISSLWEVLIRLLDWQCSHDVSIWPAWSNKSGNEHAVEENDCQSRRWSLDMTVEGWSCSVDNEWGLFSACEGQYQCWSVV